MKSSGTKQHAGEWAYKVRLVGMSSACCVVQLPVAAAARAKTAVQQAGLLLGKLCRPSGQCWQCLATGSS
jgi:hypothetical protein